MRRRRDRPPIWPTSSRPADRAQSKTSARLRIGRKVRRQARVEAQGKDGPLGSGGAGIEPSPSRPAEGGRGRLPAATRPGTAPRRRRSSAASGRRRHGRRARPPRTGAAPSRPGCGGSRGRAGPSWRSRSPASRARPAARTPARYCSAARSSSCSSRALLAPAPRARRGGQMVAHFAGQPLRVRIVQRQRVERKMVRGQVQRRLQAAPPARHGLAGHVVEQIQADRGDARRPGPRHGRGHVRRGVAPAEASQLAGVHALRPERDAIHARGGEGGQVAALARGRGWPRASPPPRAPGRSGGATIAISRSSHSPGTRDGVPPPK